MLARKDFRRMVRQLGCDSPVAGGLVKLPTQVAPVLQSLADGALDTVQHVPVLRRLFPELAALPGVLLEPRPAYVQSLAQFFLRFCIEMRGACA